jgi:hypothetical protein
VVNDDGGVCAEDELARVMRGYRLSFFAGEPAYVVDGGFAGIGKFGNVRSVNSEIDSGVAKEFGATWGRGGEDEHGDSIVNGREFSAGNE